jgi:chromosome segregation ATPase
VDVVVTLPRHERFGSLTEEQQARWQDYERRVAAHEQRHVDIFSEVIAAAKVGVESLSDRFSDCGRLDREANELWDAAFERDAALQDDFHRGEAGRSADLRAPLEAAIAENESRLALLNARLEGWSEELAELEARIVSLDSGLEPYVTEMDAIRLEYPDLTLSQDVFEEYGRLYSESTVLNDERNAVAAQHGELVEGYNGSSDEFNSINSRNNELIEELNWLP